MNTSSRRDLLGASTASPALSTLALTTSPDAALLAACAAFDALERRITGLRNGCATVEDEEAVDPVVDDLLEQQDPLFRRICATRAETRAGVEAKARTFMLFSGPLLPHPDDENADWSDRLIASVARDLGTTVATTSPAVTATEVEHPDIKLFSACAAFIELSVKRKAILEGPDAILDDDEAEAMVAPIEKRMSIVLARMEKLRATTAVGVTAKARALAAHHLPDFQIEAGRTGGVLQSMLYDAMGVSA